VCVAEMLRPGDYYKNHEVFEVRILPKTVYVYLIDWYMQELARGQVVRYTKEPQNA
jgi:hypothetical protein